MKITGTRSDLLIKILKFKNLKLNNKKLGKKSFKRMLALIELLENVPNFSEFKIIGYNKRKNKLYYKDGKNEFIIRS